MLVLEDAPARIRASFSFEEAVLQGVAQELDDATLDTGPIDSEASRASQHLSIIAYPAAPNPSGPFSAPTTSCHPPAWPTCDVELEHSVFGGDSPLSSPSPSRSPSPTKNSNQRRNQRKSRSKRTGGRRKDKEKDDGALQKERAVKTHVAPAEEKKVEYSAADIPCASTGYVATREKAGGVHSLEHLLEKGFELVKWDGTSSKPIVDSNGLVVAALVGQPNDPGWQRVHEDAFEQLQENAPLCDFGQKCMHHRRGNFAALNAGISFGGGPQAPGNLCHSKVRTEVLRRLCGRHSFIRLAGFASSAFSAWMPKLHRHYKTNLDALTSHDPGLIPNFKNSVWAAAAFNFGPRTVTGKHRDAANIPYGICSVTALGKFDYTKGGHLVLWEFGLIIEFPPGSTVLIPSAAVSHSNTPIAAHECRSSFTQYSAGGLFRWVDQGYQKSSKYLKSLSKKEAEELQELNKARCALGMSLFSTLDELRAPGKKTATQAAQSDRTAPPLP